jgi:hypothetical protein
MWYLCVVITKKIQITGKQLLASYYLLLGGERDSNYSISKYSENITNIEY